MVLICFSHLRWNFVYQRPQHLLSRVAGSFPVFYVEEPLFHDADDQLDIRTVATNIQVIVPHLKHGDEDAQDRVRKLLSQWHQANAAPYIAWFYTPMAIGLLQAFEEPVMVVYDCMDELSAFRFAPPELKDNERRLLEMADVVFTGGVSLYEAKKNQHHNIYPFPSSIDKEHFGKALKVDEPPADQQQIPHPRIGFFGVLDERFDHELIGELAQRRPDWQFVLIGPVVKIDPAILPRNANIHYLGGRDYQDLPRYLGGWDVALIPFAINESTKFISPTKTPEYLAGGVPVVSTPIADVVDPYGRNGLVHIANNAIEFEEATLKAIPQKENINWRKQVHSWLSGLSWDTTWEGMLFRINAVLANKSKTIKKKESVNV